MMSLTELKATQTHYSTAFFAGDLAMLVIGEWFPGHLQNARTEGLFKGFTWDDWALTRMPDNHDTYRTFGNPTFNHIHADAKNPEAAFDVIGWMAGADGAETVAKAGFLPAQIPASAQEALRANIPDDESFMYYVENRVVKPQFYTRYGTRVEQAIGEITEMYLLDELPDAKLASTIQQRMEEIVKTSN
jgi:ABC-type glycerol-3-phosphate transport system substrate-binding protein